MAYSDVITRSRVRRALPPALQSGPPPSAETAAAVTAGDRETIDPVPPAVAARHRWQRRYAARLTVTDTGVIIAAVVLAQYVRFGTATLAPGLAETLYVTGTSVLIAVLWMGAMAAFRTRACPIIGAGIEEYRRVTAASFTTFGALAIAELLVKLEMSRGYLAVALPVGTVGLLLNRWLNRRQVAARRVKGGYGTAVLAIGDPAAAAHLVAELTSNPTDGYHVVGVCIPGLDAPKDDHLAVGGQKIPIIGGEDQALQAIRTYGADTVALAGTGCLGVQRLRRLMWELEPMGVDLMVSPGVVDVALSRLVMRPVSGLPLLQVEKPQYRGAKRFQKRAFDFGFALMALTVTSPILVVAAILIKLTSRGPVFYCSERIGVDGQPFPMLKLRSMVEDADQQFESLMAKNESDGLLFKIREDPRITPVGRLLRRFSIDELPQFINVLRQDMSIVGPRPPLRREVEAYDGDVLRRLLVKPGITGLWQVSGRSDLSWDKSIRLDLSYVDNWSMVGDIVIVAKTLRAVLLRDGAY
ncbi:sugar transferase [Mycolicibacterium vaccae]|uniref:sugar transferase n=1 Tax=Mycolicibacterium vaccae TaxID=1810 RepID=UPI003CE9058B